MYYGLAMVPFFVTFQYSCIGQAEKIFPSFQVKGLPSAFLLSAFLLSLELH